MYTSFTDWESGLYLEHHGVKGQKWGVRNYQNSDGTLTAAGRAHYGVGQGGSRRMARQYNRQMRKLNKLKARADIETQRANAEKYDKRAAKAVKVGTVAAGEELEHYGIPGMKWGVRRYQSKDGTLTALGKSRYGAEGTGASARKMQRDFNNLDEGYARQNAEREQAVRDIRKYVTRAGNRALKKGYDTREKGMADRRVRRNMEKAEKAGKTLKLTEARMKEIESLQMRIIGHAAKRGYTVTSKPFIRYANTGRQIAHAYLIGMGIGGGAITGALVGASLAANATKTEGQKVKIRKNGDGSVRLTNYAQKNKRG